MGGSRVAVQHLSAEGVIGNARYTLIDLSSLNFHACLEPPNRFICMDVTNTEFADNSFDVILCNHTLPYVRDDARALAEIFQCLKSECTTEFRQRHGLKSHHELTVSFKSPGSARFSLPEKVDGSLE